MTIYDYVKEFPKVFAIIKQDDREMLGIRNDAELIDLFNAYSELVHYIDGQVIITLETLIKKELS